MSMSTHLRKFLFILILSFNKQKVYLFKSPFKYKMIWQCLSVSSGPGFLDKPKSKLHLMLPCGCRLLAGRRGFVGIKDCHAELGKCSSDCSVHCPQSSTTRINGLESRLFRCMAEVWSEAEMIRDVMKWECFQVSLSDVKSLVFAQSSLCPWAGIWLVAWSPSRPLIGQWPPSPTGLALAVTRALSRNWRFRSH